MRTHTIVFAVIIAALCLFQGCRQTNADERSQSGTFIWTAPEPGCGILIEYDLRWTNDSTLDMSLWNQAYNEPYPGAADSQDSCAIDLSDGISFGRIRSRNSYGLWSEWSNIALKDICSQTPVSIANLK